MEREMGRVKCIAQEGGGTQQAGYSHNVEIIQVHLGCTWGALGVSTLGCTNLGCDRGELGVHLGYARGVQT